MISWVEAVELEHVAAKVAVNADGTIDMSVRVPELDALAARIEQITFDWGGELGGAADTGGPIARVAVDYTDGTTVCTAYGAGDLVLGTLTFRIDDDRLSVSKTLGAQVMS